MLPGRHYDQWMFASRHGYQPTFAIERNCERKGDYKMTEPKPDLEKFDPSEWEFAASITQRDAIHVMNEGGVVWSGALQIYFRLRDDGVFCCFYTTKPWEWTPSALPNGGVWCIVVPRPKPSPAKPADPTAEAILNALRDGKRVVDADGDKVAICWWDTINEQWLDRNVCFPLTIKPEPKPRRRVTREEAIIAMVRDPEQRAWREDGTKLRMSVGCHMQMENPRVAGDWYDATAHNEKFLYLDPPEVER